MTRESTVAPTLVSLGLGLGLGLGLEVTLTLTPTLTLTSPHSTSAGGVTVLISSGLTFSWWP